MAVLTLDPEEEVRNTAWYEGHLKQYHDGEEPYAGAIGGRVSYKIIYTSIGTILKVECATCKGKDQPRDVYSFDLTDYSDW